MKELENKVIVFDDSCPMCKAYTAGFVQMGWLNKRTGFANASPEMLAKLDLNRARHEIPLLDTETGEVKYGLDALFHILGTKMPWLKPLFKSVFFRAPLYQLYQIITYNRRIIAAGQSPKTGFDCAPDVNVFYRWVYIGIALLISALVLFPLSNVNFSMAWVLPAFHGLALLAGLFAAHKLDFIGHWATVLLVNALLFTFLPANTLVVFALVFLSLWMWYRRWPQVNE